MRRKLLLGIFFSIILISVSVDGQGLGDIWPKAKVRIIDFHAPDGANVGEMFPINVAIRNDRILPVRITIQVGLLNGMLESIKKNIGKESMFVCPGKTSKIIPIDCIVREGDIDWYREEYNIQAVLFMEFPLMGRSILRDSSTVRGIHVKSRLQEKDKVRIFDVDVPEELDMYKDNFYVKVWVINEGAFEVEAKVQVDVIEKPSAIPELEKLGLLKGFAAERKELGISNEKILEPYYGKDKFIVKCDLRSIESKKEQIKIEALLFVNIDGREYQVDSSTLYEIYHEQPFLREENYLLIIGLAFGGLIAFFMIVVIIRVLYPLYHIKKIKLKEEKERIDERRKT